MNKKKLEKKLTQTSIYKTPINKGIGYLRNTIKNPYIQTGILMGTTALTTSLLNLTEAYASQEILTNTHNYGLLAGLWDGLLAVPNFIIGLCSDSTFASDGTGVISEPNTGPDYYLGFFITGGAKGLFFGMLGGDGDDNDND